MQLIRHLNSLPEPSVITIGNFDALHLGHHQLLKKLIQIAEEKKCPSVVISFNPLPPEYFAKQALPKLSGFREKYEQLKQAGIHYFLCLPFTQALASCQAETFVKDYLVKRCKMRALLVGENFRFGAERKGDIQLLRHLSLQSGFDLMVEPLLHSETARISSTRIRQLLTEGKLNEASTLMGRRYSLQGHVTYGDAKGRELGFPTANIPLQHLPPLKGVFRVLVHGLAKTPLAAVANIGNRPTLSTDTRPRLEVHILDFNGNLYGRRLRIEFLDKIREERKFSSIEALQLQISNDIAVARSRFDNP